MSCVKNKMIWQLLLIIEIIPFIAPFVGFVYEILISSSWTLIDWLVMYSFVYWPTYIIGLVSIILSISKLHM